MRHCTTRGIDASAALSGVKPCAEGERRRARSPEFDVIADVDELRQVEPELALAAVAIRSADRRRRSRRASRRVGVTLQAMPTRGAKSFRSGWISVRSRTLPSLRDDDGAGRRIDVGQQVVRDRTCGVKYLVAKAVVDRQRRRARHAVLRVDLPAVGCRDPAGGRATAAACDERPSRKSPRPKPV